MELLILAGLGIWLVLALRSCRRNRGSCGSSCSGCCDSCGGHCRQK